MTIQSTNNLIKEKKKISFLFTLSIFAIIVFLEISFLVFKYIDYQKSEFGRLNSQTEVLLRGIMQNPNFIKDITNIIGDEPRPPIPYGDIESENGKKPRKIRIQNFFIYNNTTRQITFSPIKDDELYEEILNTIDTNYMKNTFLYNSQEYFFINNPIDNDYSIFSFIESRITLNDILIDLSEYIFFAILLAILIYYLSIKFVSRTLQPVEENIYNMEQFIHNAGHELKTPISVIKSYLQLAKLKKNYSEAINESVQELDKMNNLIQALISLSIIKGDIENEKLNINFTIKNIVKNFGDKIDEKNLKVDIIENFNLELEVNKEYFNIFFINFLSNAIKYNKPLGKITITIDKNILEVRDTGKGINKENISKIFDRFYKESESREENSSGIGLSIAKRIADIYSWNISVSSQKGVETKFLIKF